MGVTEGTPPPGVTSSAELLDPRLTSITPSRGSLPPPRLGEEVASRQWPAVEGSAALGGCAAPRGSAVVSPPPRGSAMGIPAACGDGAWGEGGR